MRFRGRSGFGLALLLLDALLVPTAAPAQTGFYVTPSVSLAEIYDDNVFLTPAARESDFITRVTPDLQGGYQSPAFSLLGRYTFDAEVFTRHTELTNPQARQLASLELGYLPTPLVTLSLYGSYQTTETSADLNPQTRLTTGRSNVERILVRPSVIYRLSPVMNGTASYSLTRDTADPPDTPIVPDTLPPPEPATGTTVYTHVANVGLDRRLTERDTADVGYTLRRFDFSGGTFGAGDTTTSHLLMVGWTRHFTPLTSVTLRAGPRVTDGSVDPEAFVSIRRLLKFGEASLTYYRTQTTVIGQPGVVESNGFTATLTYQPLPSLRLTATPGFFLSSGIGGEARVYRGTLEASYQITRSIGLAGSYDFTLQQGTVVAGGPPAEDIQHNVFLVRLTVAFSYPNAARLSAPGRNP